MLMTRGDRFLVPVVEVDPLSSFEIPPPAMQGIQPYHSGTSPFIAEMLDTFQHSEAQVVGSNLTQSGVGAEEEGELPEEPLNDDILSFLSVVLVPSLIEEGRQACDLSATQVYDAYMAPNVHRGVRPPSTYPKANRPYDVLCARRMSGTTPLDSHTPAEEWSLKRPAPVSSGHQRPPMHKKQKSQKPPRFDTTVGPSEHAHASPPSSECRQSPPSGSRSPLRTHHRKPDKHPIQMRETRRFDTRADLRDVHNFHFPRFPYAFDDPTLKDVRKAKDGSRKVENMSIGGMVDYV